MKIIRCFKSQREAARQLGIHNSSINVVIKGQREKTCGYYFYQADEYVVEKTRERFGNEVAKKVEELIRQNQ